MKRCTAASRHPPRRRTRTDALDPELIAWVHTCIPWAIMNAFDRYRRPLTTEEKDRYLTEQAVIGRMGGAEWVPEIRRRARRPTSSEMTPEDGDERADARSFIDFLAGDTREVPTRSAPAPSSSTGSAFTAR